MSFPRSLGARHAQLRAAIAPEAPFSPCSSLDFDRNTRIGEGRTHVARPHPPHAAIAKRTQERRESETCLKEPGWCWFGSGKRKQHRELQRTRDRNEVEAAGASGRVRPATASTRGHPAHAPASAHAPTSHPRPPPPAATRGPPPPAATPRTRTPRIRVRARLA